MGACASVCSSDSSEGVKQHNVGHNIRNFTNTMHVTEPALADLYRGVKKLGEGSAAEVWLCRSLRAGEPDVALKLFRRPFQEAPQSSLSREIQVPMDLSEGCVSMIDAYDAYLTPQHLVLSLEPVLGGNLKAYLDVKASKASNGYVMDEDEARYFFQQIVLSLVHLHEHSWTHRDVKLSNVLLTKSDPHEVRFCDFGFAKPLDDPAGRQLATTHLGTYEYMSPELLENAAAGQQSPYDPRAVDVWSSGVMLTMLLFGSKPFNHNRAADAGYSAAEEALWKVETSRPWYEADLLKGAAATISPEGKDLLDRIFTIDPVRRISMREVQQHPWLQKPLSSKYQRVASSLASRQAQLEQTVGLHTADAGKVAARRSQLEDLVMQACASQGQKGL
ncbi:hypothetical protein WJX74_000353 [Apatococcus lobatus]|uniref:Protein kinase domain-containing protein n=1 Tax=Apatococcus lobatus TaxID=904363 RepID=A0AAW1Q6E2_9CHLO